MEQALAALQAADEGLEIVFRAAERERGGAPERPPVAAKAPFIPSLKVEQILPLGCILGTAIIRKPRRATDIFTGKGDSGRVDHHVFGWPLDLTIICSGLLVIIYTVAGGSDAVTVTQKYQLGIIFAGMVTAFCLLVVKRAIRGRGACMGVIIIFRGW